MKKLTKESFGRLRKSFPVADEQTLSGMKGGSYYYDTSGNFLCFAGSNHDVRVVTYEESLYIHYGQRYDGAGVLFSQCNSEVQSAILASFLNSESYSSINITSNGSIIAGYATTTNASGTSNVFIYNSSQSFVWNDYDNLSSTMVHESYHYSSGHISSGLTERQRQQNEIDTILYQVNHSSYTYVTQEYRETTAAYLYEQWSRLGLANTSGHTFEDARTACKVFR
ncbi:MAG: hypothetical protein LBL04_02905 [Bacteroidales bacterium]|jgi:hypothetical protein|nr:hypothetical protein [Bacteroidales bacterium]